MRRACLSRPSDGRQLLALRGGNQFLVGRLAPEEERQPRGEVDVGDAIGAARARVGRRLLETEDEIGARQDRFERGAHAGLEAVLGRFAFVERHDAIDLGGAERPSVGLAAEPRDDLARARALIRRRGRTAAEDFLPARRHRDAGGLVRPANDDVAQLRERGDAAAARTAAGVRPLVRLDQIFVQGRRCA